MLKNATVFKLKAPFTLDAATVAEKLGQFAFRPCEPSERLSIGWKDPYPGSENEQLARVTGDFLLMRLYIEEKMLPSAVIKKKTEERVRDIEAKQGRKVGKKERKELQEAVAGDLLLKAFSKESSITAAICPKQGYLLLDATSPTKADMFLTSLRHVLGEDLNSFRLSTEGSPSTLMTDWLQSGETPDDFTVDAEAEFVDPSGPKIKASKQDLWAEEIRMHLNSGKSVNSLALTWAEKMSFVVNNDLVIKKIQLLDILQDSIKNENPECHEDMLNASYLISLGSLTDMLDALIQAFGGLPDKGA